MDATDRQSVELFVRTLAPSGATGAQEEIVDRLIGLEREGVVESVDLTVWGSALRVDGSCARFGNGREVAERVRSFRRWARERDVSLEPHLTTSAVDSAFTGESFERVVLPHRCLAVYEGDGLLAVYPHRNGDVTRTLADGIRALERRATDRAVPDGDAGRGRSRPEDRGDVQDDGDGLGEKQADQGGEAVGPAE